MHTYIHAEGNRLQPIWGTRTILVLAWRDWEKPQETKVPTPRRDMNSELLEYGVRVLATWLRHSSCKYRKYLLFYTYISYELTNNAIAIRFTHSIQYLPQCGWDNILSGTFRSIHQFQKPKMAVNKCQTNSVRATYQKKSYELDSMHRMAEGY
jgi:hypothetical protein